ncbi:MAG TPA: uroporphyrinogen decarboxylase, partial [Spirochaetia bacterium]|nr:uroporphyrinogen decarboxylase [Spirochaetia bacterium]
MNKNILFQTLNHEKTERVPWVPYTGVQIGSLQGCNAEKLYRSSDLLLKCLKESNRLYSPDGQPVIFDLQI